VSARGLRNCNAGNLRHGSQWKGMEVAQLDKDFIQFTEPEWGIRALVILLFNYARKFNIHTLHSLVARYAPASENNCAAYEQALSKALGVHHSERIDWTEPLVMRTLVKAIVKHENGVNPYPDKVIEEGMRRAGLEMPAKETT